MCSGVALQNKGMMFPLGLFSFRWGTLFEAYQPKASIAAALTCHVFRWPDIGFLCALFRRGSGSLWRSCVARRS